VVVVAAAFERAVNKEGVHRQGCLPVRRTRSIPEMAGQGAVI
jgi:hypothetical protein